MPAPIDNRQAGSVDVVVIGAGHSGLAMSRELGERGIEHVVLERGEVANSWRHERWDSLRLLTPNWQARLPGFAYSGSDPDGYLTMPEVIDFIQAYANRVRAPVLTGARVTHVRARRDGYLVTSEWGEWVARCVVLASGAFNTPLVPKIADRLPHSIRQMTTREYRNPDSTDAGGVLVVGASATGLQLAEEIHESGRPVTLAVGEHVRMPRKYRGRDIQFWMDRTGLLDQPLDAVDDIRRARGVPSPQLVGSDDGRTLDLNALVRKGVRLAGRLAGVAGKRLQFSGSLRNVCALADLKLQRLLDGIDDWIDENGYGEQVGPSRRFEPTAVDESPPMHLDPGRDRIRTVLWATGFAPDYSWLDVPVFDRKGRIRHDGGVAGTPGLYLLGLPFLRRRKSSFIHGAADDVRDIGAHLAVYLDQSARHRILRRAG